MKKVRFGACCFLSLKSREIYHWALLPGRTSSLLGPQKTISGGGGGVPWKSWGGVKASPSWGGPSGNLNPDCPSPLRSFPVSPQGMPGWPPLVGCFLQREDGFWGREQGVICSTSKGQTSATDEVICSFFVSFWNRVLLCSTGWLWNLVCSFRVLGLQESWFVICS
jgi:hypothetical protein